MAALAPDVKSVLRKSWRVMEMLVGFESLPEQEKEDFAKPAPLLEDMREKLVSEEIEAVMLLVSPNKVTDPDMEKENLPFAPICRA